MSDTEQPPVEVEAEVPRQREEKPPRVEPTIRGKPKIRNFYWCRFPKDAELPEMWKLRPVIVVSGDNKFYGAVTVIPCSTQAQTSKYAFPLRTSIDGRAGWALCDKPTTVAVSRLVPQHGGVRRMPEEEFQEMLAHLYSWLPKLVPKPDPVPVPVVEPEG